MKKFNLEEAKAGKQVITREGLKVTAMLFDRHFDNGDTIVVVVESTEGFEEFFSTKDDGTFFDGNGESGLDLFMAAEHKEGWINIYKNRELCNSKIYESFEAANVYATEPNFVSTIKIEWDE